MVESVRIIIANGVNLDLCGRRKANLYSSFTLMELEKYLREHVTKLAPLFGFQICQLVFFQTNDEHEFLTEITKHWQGAILNPGAWTHTSLALGDRLEALSLPFIEVHISHLARREKYRRRSYCAEHALGVISGLGMDSYLAALTALLSYLGRMRSPSQGRGSPSPENTR